MSSQFGAIREPFRSTSLGLPVASDIKVRDELSRLASGLIKTYELSEEAKAFLDSVA